MAAAAAVAICPPRPPYLPALGSISHRFPAVSASPICPILRIRRLPLPHFNSCTFRRLVPVSHFRNRNLGERSIEGCDAAKFVVPAGRSRLCSRAELFELKGGVCRRRGLKAGAIAGIGAEGERGDSEFFDYKWAEKGAAEVAGGAKEFLILALNNLQVRKERIIQWATWLAVVVGTVTLVGSLASMFAVGRVIAAIVIAASFFGFLVEDEKLQLIGEGFESVYGNAGHQVHILSGAISKVAHDFHRFLASSLSSVIPTLAGKFRGDNVENSSKGGRVLISESGVVSLALRCNCKDFRTDNLSIHRKPAVEALVTNISESIAQLSSILSTAGLSAAHPDSLSGIKSEIQDLCRELQSVEAALLTPQCEFDFKVNQGIVEAPYSQQISAVLPSNPQQEQISDQPLSTKCILVEELSKAPPFHQSVTSLSDDLEGKEETSQVSPPPSGTWSITATAGDEAKVEESLPSEVLDTISMIRPTIESISAIGESSSKVSGSHIVDFREFSPATNSLVEEQVAISNHLISSRQSLVMGAQRRRSGSPDPWQNDCTTRPTDQDQLARGSWVTSSADLSGSKQTQVIELQRTRSRSPDPRQDDCATGRIEQDVLARGIWAANSSNNSRNEEGRELLDLWLIDYEHSKAETPSKDGVGNGRGVNAYGKGDFWGKNAGSITKTSEQRGTLTKSYATARGSSFGSMDKFDDDRPQEQRRRKSLEEEQQQLLRRDLSSRSSSRAGQPWDEQNQPGVPSREPVRDDRRMYRDADSSPAADDYRRVEAGTGGPPVLRVGRDLEGTKNTPPVSMEGRADEGMTQPRYRTDARGDIVYPASVERRPSPPGRTVSTRISNRGPSTSLEGEGRWSTQSMDDARVTNEGKYSGSKRVWDKLPNPEGAVSRGQESSSGNGKGIPDSLTYTPTQPEVIESNFALEQSKQAQTVQLQNYLHEAEALLEQGMQGLEGRIEVGVAERMLYEAADLLGKACEVYPADLSAVGQLGNTLLVHGQLKLKLSQQLRSMLPSPTANSAALAGREQESLEMTLQEVCEECEELLVDAGRKFRTALSIDKIDVRALYNWGLALCYRGQLIAEEGGEKAMQDADKVYLAAIDKFEAMVGISQDYVSGALVNWGLAMRYRARLRDMGDKDRVQLLLQSRELFQDAVRLDPNNGQARGALAVCSAELKELQGFESLQRVDTMEKPNRNWWQRRG